MVGFWIASGLRPPARVFDFPVLPMSARARLAGLVRRMRRRTLVALAKRAPKTKAGQCSFLYEAREQSWDLCRCSPEDGPTWSNPPLGCRTRATSLVFVPWPAPNLANFGQIRFEPDWSANRTKVGIDQSSLTPTRCCPILDGFRPTLTKFATISADIGQVGCSGKTRVFWSALLPPFDEKC